MVELHVAVPTSMHCDTCDLHCICLLHNVAYRVLCIEIVIIIATGINVCHHIATFYYIATVLVCLHVLGHHHYCSQNMEQEHKYCSTQESQLVMHL